MTISGLSDVTDTYGVSGITAYTKGIKYGGVYIAGNGDEVSLTLSHTDAAAGYTFNGYTVSGGGSLDDETSDTPTLTMTDANQAISAMYAANATIDVTANLTGGAYWTTFYSNAANYQAPEGTQVFAVILTGTAIEMTEIHNRIALSGKGVVLKNTTTGSITMTKTGTAPDVDYSGSSLTGTMTSITNPGNAFVLNKGTNGVGFYRLTADGTIGANKAYLTYSGALAREFFLFDEATGIQTLDNMANSPADHAAYDLQGRRVAQPTKGLYIVNGKKVVR